MLSSVTSALPAEFLSRLLPSVCLICETPFTKAATKTGCCHRCEERISQTPELAWTHADCEICAEPRSDASLSLGLPFCAACSLFTARDPFYSQLKVRSVWHFESIIEEMIKAFKYRAQLGLADFLVRSSISFLTETEEDWSQEADLILPLPSSRKSMRQRGFSQTALLAKGIAKAAGIPVTLNALVDSSRRKSQTAVSDRYMNVRGAFEVKRRKVEGSRILLIDDVITSGASGFEAAKALVDAGAARVSLFSLARSKAFSKLRLRHLLEDAEITES